MASDIVEIVPITSQQLLVHFSDGRVIHHKHLQKRSDEKVIVDPLDVKRASSGEAYLVSCAADSFYEKGIAPEQAARKSKGMDFAWFVDRWEDGRAVNDRPDHVKHHWITLTLPRPMQSGNTYTVDTGSLAKNGNRWTVRFDQASTRSEAVHVNTVGYTPNATAKYGYVYWWSGDHGSLDVKPVVGRRFWLVDQQTQVKSFEGKVAFRESAENAESAYPSDTPKANFLAADVAECDFSSFTKSGKYVLAVEGVGCSFPFRIEADVYREPFRTVARGLYHNRSGIALKRPYTEFERPAPHNPKLTPGFAGKLKYTTSRWIDWKNPDADTADKPAIEAGIKGPLESWGWYQDAGDWDSYASHIRVPQELLLAYQLAPKNFVDRELNIPESGNGVPDILDEAAWLPRFCQRLRHELIRKGWGTGGIGLRVCGDHFGGDTGPKDIAIGSWEDVDRTYIVSGEDPVSTYGYAGAAAQLAVCLKLAGVQDPEKVDWAREARESYAWAYKNTRPGDEKMVGPNRLYAAASLFRLTGDRAYEAQVRADTKSVTSSSEFWTESLYGPAVYALAGGPTPPDPDLLQRIRGAILHTADLSVETANRRALRWGGNWWHPMLIGQQTTPLVMEVAVGHGLTRTAEPARAQKYLSGVRTTCDYFLGTNALNQTWCTGLGPRHPANVFHLDAWYNGKDGPHPGIIPYGPTKKSKERGIGPWEADWVNPTCYPPIESWPGNERWFENRGCPMTSEFTIHQTTAPSAAIFGFLCAERKP